MEKKFYVIVDGVKIIPNQGYFEFDDGALLWQCLSEDLKLELSEDELIAWEDLDDDSIVALLDDAKNKEFISDYEVVEMKKNF